MPGGAHPEPRRASFDQCRPRRLLEVELSLTPPSKPPRALRRKLHTLRFIWHVEGPSGVRAAARAKLRHSISTRTGWTPPPPRQPSCQAAARTAPLELRDVPPSSTWISVIVPVHDTPARILDACLSSVLAQTHERWQLCICDDHSTHPDTRAVLARYADLDARVGVVRPRRDLGVPAASNVAAEVATGDFLAFLDAGDELHPQALAEIAHAVDVDATIDLLYTDEDELEADGSRSGPVYKPGWSPDYLHACNYVLHCLCIRSALFRQLGGLRSEYDGAQDWDLALRASRTARLIRHIPRILYHRRKPAGSAAEDSAAKPNRLDAGRRALADAAAHLVPPATVGRGLLPGTYRLRRDLEQRPPVTLLILSGDPLSDVEGRGRMRILANFLRSIIATSTYPDYTVLVIDDGDLSTESAELLEACGGGHVTFPREDGAAFNFSRKVNFAVGCVQTEHFVLLNDDLEVISPGWIEALMDYAVDPGVAAVCGRTLLVDGSIQHCGLVCAPTGAHQIFYRLPRDEIGYSGFSHVVRNYAAVTAALLAGRRSAWREIGPFDEAFAHDYNDVDFCLRAWSRGYRVVYTPFCELYHFENTSLVRTASHPDEILLFQERWQEWAKYDPFFPVDVPGSGLALGS